MSAATEDILFGKLRDAVQAQNGEYHDTGRHVVSLLPQGSRRLAITFDNLAAKREAADRMPWGYDFLAAANWDVMGVMSKSSNWFRESTLYDLFDHFRDARLFQHYDQVALYGSSMGGFGACAFASAVPGCTVFAFAPQRSLAPELAHFELRYRYGRRQGDWTDPRYRDGAEGIKAARRVYLAYDPRERLDGMHVAMLTGPNVMPLVMPGVGHKIPPMLLKMGILKPLAQAALMGTLEPMEFHQLYRQRRNSVPWVERLLSRALARKHYHMGAAAGERAMSMQPHWKIRHQLNALRAAAKDLGP
ncbi:hypothetical protein [Neogemmobacter tilapiae]|uniref:Phosphoadenosine phosphosulfate reductase n=1 Tax=Neogemmobacter tilapiae TaxID=875041 RepID=A0A918TLT0_9RHOB|nr:hypothetical protein [Gemmobacter tilapiae]GHC51510.1 hypothetical protein GCM10007315_12390 [Gemmobacter tilapiae]